MKRIDPASIAKHFDEPAAAARWRRAWAEMGIHRYDASRPRAETFVVDTPPPTVSGSLHVGHVFSYTHQDVIVRYRRMRGQAIFYPMGWDDNGLPTERRVQNVYNVRCDPHVPFDADAAAEIEKAASKAGGHPRAVSRRTFIELCHKVTAADEKAFRELWQRLGLSIDWSEEYATIDDRCRAIAQRSFILLRKDGHAYQVDAPTMWDVGFQTAVAQAEIEDKVEHGAFHDVELGVEGGGSFVISTTRPELLAACVGVAAHPEDARYRRLFGKHAVTPIYRVPVPIFSSPLADPEKGTGILMVCTFGDQTDVLWWRERGLPLRQILGRDGRIEKRRFGDPGWESLDAIAANEAYAATAGKAVAAARKIVVEQLRDGRHAAVSGASARPALRAEPRPITHSVKFFEKGDHPLEILTTRQWFVRLLDKKEELIARGREIRWLPEHMGKRFENWTQGLSMDWCISRQRYFGVPIPVWYPLDDAGARRYGEPILADPRSLPVDPMTDPPPGYAEAQRDKPGGFSGEADVFDTWFTSSMTPQIGALWGMDDGRFGKLFPMDVRPQAHDIIRTWAFYTIAKAHLHHGTVPWGSALISGWILDPDRKKMSKSKGNVVTPMHLLDSYGADGVRYWAASARLGTDTAFDEKVMKNGRRLSTKLWNAAKFVLSQEASAGRIERELDLGFMAELRDLCARAAAALDEYEFAAALSATESFFWDAFTDNYLELVKRRARSRSDASGRDSAVITLRWGLSALLRLFAPVLPYVTEEIWSWVFAKELGHPSIHAAPWPSAEELSRVPPPADARSFRIACDAVAAVRRARTEKGLSLSMPLCRLCLRAAQADLRTVEAVLPDVLDASNAAAVDLVVGEHAADAPPFSADIEPAPAAASDAPAPGR